jgi:hypothetical protein
MKYLVIDAALHGSGIREYYLGGYVDIDSLRLDDNLKRRINIWLLKYENEHYYSFQNHDIVNILDDEGIEIARIVKNQLSDVKIDYFSAAKLTTMTL